MRLPRSFATLARDWASPTELAVAAVIAASAMFAVGSSRLMQQWETPRVEPQPVVSTNVTGSKSGSASPDGVPAIAKTPTNGRPFTPAPSLPRAVTSVHPSPGGARKRVQPKAVRPPTPSTETASVSAPSPVPSAPPLTLVELPAPPSVAVAPPFRERTAPPQSPFFMPADVTESPRIVTRVDPQLPETLGSRPVDDVVVVRLLVSQAGHPFRISLLRGSKAGRRLDAAVIAAVNQWTFSPARKNGEAVSCWYNLGVPIRSNGSAS